MKSRNIFQQIAQNIITETIDLEKKEMDKDRFLTYSKGKGTLRR